MKARRPLAPVGTIYLLHFSEPYHHARHYIGWTAEGRLDERLAEHRNGTGARLMAVIAQAGITFTLARTWSGSRALERRKKVQGGASRSCPLCRAAGLVPARRLGTACLQETA